VLAKPPQSLLTRTWCFVLWERVGAVATEKKGEQEDIKRTSGETIECESRSSGAPSWRQSARDGSHRPQQAARPAACLCVWCLCLRQAMFGGGGVLHVATLCCLQSPRRAQPHRAFVRGGAHSVQQPAEAVAGAGAPRPDGCLRPRSRRTLRVQAVHAPAARHGTVRGNRTSKPVHGRSLAHKPPVRPLRSIASVSSSRVPRAGGRCIAGRAQTGCASATHTPASRSALCT